MSNLGKYITNHRNIKKLSIRGLAELAHVSHTEISRLENGERKNPSLFVLKSIAIALGEDFNELLKAAGYIDDERTAPKLSSMMFEINDLTDSEIKEVREFISFLLFKRGRHSE